jgi:hypothetical protein
MHGTAQLSSAQLSVENGFRELRVFLLDDFFGITDVFAHQKSLDA